MSSAALGLSIAYWLHMLATVVWIGGLAALALLVLPAAQRTLDGKAFANLLAGIQRRLDPLGWFCLALLAGTGLFQMSANPNYQGFLATQGTWATAILLKHILFAVMTVLSAYLTWGLLPALRRGALRAAQGAAEAERLQRRNLLLLRLNLILALFVLALTALARAA
jgi:uncharacterized membrane protein